MIGPVRDSRVSKTQARVDSTLQNHQNSLPRVNVTPQLNFKLTQRFYCKLFHNEDIAKVTKVESTEISNNYFTKKIKIKIRSSSPRCIPYQILKTFRSSQNCKLIWYLETFLKFLICCFLSQVLLHTCSRHRQSIRIDNDCFRLWSTNHSPPYRSIYCRSSSYLYLFF